MLVVPDREEYLFKFNTDANVETHWAVCELGFEMDKI
jgi:hypothetical protein